MRSFLMVLAGAAITWTASAQRREEDSLLAREADEASFGGYDDLALYRRDLDDFEVYRRDLDAMDQILAIREAEPSEKYTRHSQYKRDLDALERRLAIREADPFGPLGLILKAVKGISHAVHHKKHRRDAGEHSQALLGRDIWDDFALDEFDL